MRFDVEKKNTLIIIIITVRIIKIRRRDGSILITIQCKYRINLGMS